MCCLLAGSSVAGNHWLSLAVKGFIHTQVAVPGPAVPVAVLESPDWPLYYFTSSCKPIGIHLGTYGGSGVLYPCQGYYQAVRIQV